MKKDNAIKNNTIQINTKYITLRNRAALFFAASFLLVWLALSMVLLNRFKNALVTSFDEQLRARAYLVAEKTNIQPAIVPLPQGTESFSILYTVNNNTDTLFSPAHIFFTYPLANDSTSSGEGWRAVRIQHVLENGGRIQIVYALPSDSIDSKIRNLTVLTWLALPVGCLLAFGIAYWLSSKLLKPVRQVINLANSINLNNNTALLPAPSANDELKELIVSFNRMLLRIREQSDRQTAFFASASHELRTPLSIMQTRLQVLLQGEQESGAVKDLYAGQLKEVKQLNKMVSDFLLLSELRSGKMNTRLVMVNLPDFILELVTRYKEKAVSRNISFKIAYQPVSENYDVEADEEKLMIILSNLLENAMKYSPMQAVIDCSISKSNQSVIISMTNPIRGDINPEIMDLKNQFYHSKPIHGEGFGLGLWIANQLAVMQGMELYCTVHSNQQFEARLVINPQNDL